MPTGLDLLNLAFWIAAVGGLGAAWAFVWRRYYQLDRARASVHFRQTRDGWKISLSRYRPDMSADPSTRCPLLLCPGMGFGGIVFELGEPSTAQELAASGFDTWILDARGRGDASRPRLWGGFRRVWGLDHYIEFDLPEAIDTVLAETGASQLHLITFGAAALCAYPVVASSHAEKVRSLTAMGGAALFAKQRAVVSSRWLNRLAWLPLRLMARLFAPLAGRASLPLVNLLCDRDNVDPRTYRAALVNGTCDPSSRELRQLGRWIAQDCYDAGDDETDYRQMLSSIGVPVLLVAGPRDELSPPSMVYATRDLLESAASRTVLLASRHEGMSANYGHLDMLIGRNVQRDIVPRLVQWLKDNDTAG